MQLGVYVDSSGQGKEVVRIDYARISVGPDMKAQVTVRSGSNWTLLLPVTQLQGSRWWLNQRTLHVNRSLEDEGVGDSARTYAVVFGEDLKLQSLLVHLGANSPKRRGRATVTSLRTGGLKSVDW